MSSPLDLRQFRKAFEQALKSPCNHYLIGAALYRKEKFISGGYNCRRTHPKSSRAHPNLCAELMALLRAERTAGCTLYILRTNKALSLLPIDPCPSCQQAIEEAGIKTVYTTRGEDSFAITEVKKC